MKLTDFCNAHSIAWFPIALEYSDAGKLQNNELKKKKTPRSIPHPFYNNRTPSCTDFKTLTKEQIANRQALANEPIACELLGLNAIAMDTRRIFQIDYDTPNFPPEYSLFYELSPWYASATKSYGKHVFIATDAPIETDRMKMYHTDEGDIELLANGWAYARLDAEVQNADGEILFQDAATLKNYFPKQSEPKYDTQLDAPAEKSQSKYLELLHLIGNKIKRDEWLKLTGWAVNHITKNEYLACIDDAYKSDGEKMWDDLALNPRNVSVYTIENIAKRVCPDKYKVWCKTHKRMITLDILNRGERDVCDFILEDLKRTLAYCRGKWIKFDPNTGLWKRNTTPNDRIVQAIQDAISELLSFLHGSLLNKSTDERNKINAQIEAVEAHRRRTGTGGYSSQCQRYIQAVLTDNDFYSKLDIIPYKIPFKNGLLNLETGELEKIEPDHFITATLNRNYRRPQEHHKTAVRDALFKICNCNPEHLDYYLSSLGYAFCGDASREQLFWSMYGATAANGKSTIFDALNIICPQLVSKLGSEFFELHESSRHKTFASFTGLTRLIFANEITKKKQDVDFIKQIADGGNISYNPLYADKYELRIGFKAFIISNNPLNFSNDNGIERRLRTCNFTSTFRDVEDEYAEQRIFKADKGMLTKLTTEWADALLDIIFEYANKYIHEKCLKPYPTEWKAENDEIVDVNNQFAEVLDLFEFHPTYAITKDELTEVLREHGITYNRIWFRGEIARFPKYNVSYNTQKVVRRNGKNTKGVWIGMRKKQDDVPVVEEEELIEE